MCCEEFVGWWVGFFKVELRGYLVYGVYGFGNKFYILELFVMVFFVGIGGGIEYVMDVV